MRRQRPRGTFTEAPMSPANPKRTLVAQAGLHSGTGPLLGFPTFPEDYFKNFGALRMMAHLARIADTQNS